MGRPLLVNGTLEVIATAWGGGIVFLIAQHEGIQYTKISGESLGNILKKNEARIFWSVLTSGHPKKAGLRFVI